MLTVVCCDRGSPGSTTSALALAAAHVGRAIVVEADPYGGDLAVRCQPADGGRFPEVPTVLTAVVAARTETSPDVVGRYAHRFADELGVVPGFLSAEQATGVTDWTPLARVMKMSATPVVCDIGRVHAMSPSLPIAAAADVVVVVARADVGAVIHLRERLARLVGALAELRGTPPVVLPVLIAPKRHAPTQVAQLMAMIADSPVGSVVDQAGWLAWDPTGVARLEEGNRNARTRLARSAATLHGQVTDLATRSTSVGRGSPSWKVAVPDERHTVVSGRRPALGAAFAGAVGRNAVTDDHGTPQRRASSADG